MGLQAAEYFVEGERAKQKMTFGTEESWNGKVNSQEGLPYFGGVVSSVWKVPAGKVGT